MRQLGVVILRGLGQFLAWLGAGVAACLRALVEEMVRGVFSLLRPILPWIGAVAAVLALWHFRPDVAEAVITLVIIGVVLKVMIGGRKKNNK